MNIIVPVKQVPDTRTVRMDENTGTLIREGVTSIINPLDLYGIELAIRLRDRYGGVATALSMGPRQAVTSLREAIAMGLDQAVCISDKVFAGSDTWATSYALAEGIRKLASFDLVICGERATDGDTGQVGAGIAAFLDLPVATYVSGVEDVTDSSVRVRRLVEGGYERVELALPAVLTVVKEVSDPRLPTLAGKLRAKEVDVPVWSAAEMGVDPEKVGLAGSPTRVVKIFRPKVLRECEMLFARDADGIARAVDRVMERLAQKELV